MNSDENSDDARLADAETNGPAVSMVVDSTNGTALPASKRLITIVAPVFNEEPNVHRFHAAVSEVMETLSDRYEYELLFIDNCSTDQTYPLIAELAHSDRRVRALRFSRNFGFQRSVLTGYLNARGDAAIQIDCDLQDPPGMIVDFVEYWEQGYKVVYGIRRTRKEGWFQTGCRKIFYKLINALSDIELPVDAGDFRLVDRCVLDVLKTIDDSQPYVRGEIAATGFPQTGIPYDREARKHGQSHFSWGDLISIAIDGILNYSIAPLRLATYTGLFVSITTVLGAIAFFFGKLVLGRDWPAGFATLIIVTLLALSLNVLFLGVIGEYIGRVYRQVKKRPLTIIADRIDQGEDRT